MKKFNEMDILKAIREKDEEIDRLKKELEKANLHSAQNQQRKDTFQNAQEETNMANQAKMSLIQNKQYDIRNAAIGMLAFLKQLQQSENDPRLEELFGILTRTHQNFFALCNDVITISDLDQNKPVIEKMFDLREMAKDVFDLHKSAVYGKDVTLYLRVDESIPPHLFSDPFRIQQILINLLDGAIRSIERGEVFLKLSAEIIDPRNAVLKIDIIDTAMGFDTSKINSIFEKFNRMTSSNISPYVGRELALYTVKKHVDELEGHLEIFSRPNQGSKFSLSIPFRVLLQEARKRGPAIKEEFYDELNNVKRDKTMEQPTSTVKTLLPFSHNVLLIEDDVVSLMIQKHLCLTLTASIDTAQSVKEALSKLQSHHYDLVISDLGLPDGSGMDIVTWVKRNADCKNYNTPFVAVTVHQDSMVHQKALGAGFLEISTKPLSKERTHAFFIKYPIAQLKTVKEAKELPVIDLALAMKRISASDPEKAISLLTLLFNTIDEDINNLKDGQNRQDIMAIRDVLHKVRGGFCYTGVPRLEKTCAELHDAVKATDDLKEITNLFDIVYEEVRLFKEHYQKELGH